MGFELPTKNSTLENNSRGFPPQHEKLGGGGNTNICFNTCYVYSQTKTMSVCLFFLLICHFMLVPLFGLEKEEGMEYKRMCIKRERSRLERSGLESFFSCNVFHILPFPYLISFQNMSNHSPGSHGILGGNPFPYKVLP